jgi:hypothetical protein
MCGATVFPVPAVLLQCRFSLNPRLLCVQAWLDPRACSTLLCHPCSACKLRPLCPPRSVLLSCGYVWTAPAEFYQSPTSGRASAATAALGGPLQGGPGGRLGALFSSVRPLPPWHCPLWTAFARCDFVAASAGATRGRFSPEKAVRGGGGGVGGGGWGVGGGAKLLLAVSRGCVVSPTLAPLNREFPPPSTPTNRMLPHPRKPSRSLWSFG